MNGDLPHIDHEALAGALFRMMTQNEAGIERLARSFGRLLSFSDVMEMTGWGEKKLMQKIQDRTIPMVKDGEWFIPYSAFLRALDKYYESLLPRRTYRKSISEKR